jgi:hypothetical protein
MVYDPKVVRANLLKLIEDEPDGFPGIIGPYFSTPEEAEAYRLEQWEGYAERMAPDFWI